MAPGESPRAVWWDRLVSSVGSHFPWLIRFPPELDPYQNSYTGPCHGRRVQVSVYRPRPEGKGGERPGFLLVMGTIRTAPIGLESTRPIPWFILGGKSLLDWISITGEVTSGFINDALAMARQSPSGLPKPAPFSPIVKDTWVAASSPEVAQVLRNPQWTHTFALWEEMGTDGAHWRPEVLPSPKLGGILQHAIAVFPIGEGPTVPKNLPYAIEYFLTGLESLENSFGVEPASSSPILEIPEGSFPSIAPASPEEAPALWKGESVFTCSGCHQYEPVDIKKDLHGAIKTVLTRRCGLPLYSPSKG